MAEPKVVFRRTIDGVSDFLGLDENLHLLEKKEGNEMKSWWGWFPLQILGITFLLTIAIVLIAHLLAVWFPLK